MSNDLAVIEPQELSTVATKAAPDITGMLEYAEIVIKSGIVAKGLETKEKLVVAMMCGHSLGLDMSQSTRSIMVVNNRPCVWGDMALALVRRSPVCVSIEEKIAKEGEDLVASCTGIRKGSPNPETRKFSQAMAAKAGLWGKAGPWSQYPARMLQMRARGFLLRDLFPDLLNGLGIAEEVNDYEPIPAKRVTSADITIDLPDPGEEPEPKLLTQENE